MAKRSSARTPRIEPLALNHLTEGEGAALVAGADLDGLRFERLVAPASLAGTTLLECEVTELTADRLDMRGARVLESRLARWAAPTIAAHGSSWRDAELIESRIGALDVTDADVRRLVVEGSKLGWVNLRGSTVHDVVFRNCTFDELDFGGAQLARVAFEDCVTEKLTLTQARADGLDLRGLEFHAIEGLEGLRGATISGEQTQLLAETFAAHFGATVEG
ncbi:pentapeptide repeat-containing protein [Nonlabens tegetincola]